MNEDVTYWLELDFLSDGNATFTGDHGVKVDLPRDKWVALNRPSHIQITPLAVSAR